MNRFVLNKQTITISVVMFTLGMVVLIGFAMKMPKHNATQAEMEESFTPEQKAVIAAWQKCAAEMNQARTQLEQTKRELTDMIAAAHATAISKGVDPNVYTTWLPCDGNGVTCDGKQVLIGYREDGLLIWKRQ